MSGKMFAVAAVSSILLIAGCGTTKYIVKPEPVTVNKPVLSCPIVSDVQFPRIELETEKLTKKSTPGEVARAYNLDMHALTQRISEYNRLIAELAAAQDEAKLAQQRIDKIFQENNDKIVQQALDKQKQENAGK